MESTPLSDQVIGRLQRVFRAAADPVAAGPMRAYMRGQFEFLGIATRHRRALSRQVLAGLPDPVEADLRAVALACWRLTEREYQYFACDLLRRYATACSAGFLDTAHRLISTKSWWDTVDALAAHVVGGIVANHPGTVSTMDEWIDAENIWLARTAILHQLTHKDATDKARLFGYCLRRADDRDFFIRKAIGWALRRYADTDPYAVRDFVTANGNRLAPLSIREAVRNLGPATR